METYCAGVRSLEGGARVDENTVFQLASVSKPIGSTIAAAQVARGDVAWSTPVAELDPRFPLARPGVTFESLLAHRSGLPGHAGDLLEDTGYTRDEVLSRLKLLPLVPPDTTAARYSARYAYTNSGYTLGACAIASAKGHTYAGTYTHNFYGPITVRRDQAGLRMKVGTIECPLDHFDGDTFTYVPPGENGGIRSGVTFGGPTAAAITELRATHLFEPYPLDENPPDDTADTWHGVYTADTRLRIPAHGVIRKYSFVAKRSLPLQLVVYRRRDAASRYMKCAATKLVTAKEGANEFFAENLEVEEGDIVGFYQSDQGVISFHLEERGYDRGRGNLTGFVLFTTARATDPNAFEYSSARRYHLSIEFAWGLRGPGSATQI